MADNTRLFYYCITFLISPCAEGVNLDHILSHLKECFRVISFTYLSNFYISYSESLVLVLVSDYVLDVFC